MTNSINSYIFKKKIVLLFFKYLEKNKIDYCYLGDPLNFPQKIKSDVDLFVDFKNLKDLKKILSNFTSNKKFKIINYIQYEFSHFNIIISKNSKGIEEYISLDMCNEFVHDSKKLINFKNIKKINFKKKTFTFKILPKKYEFLYYFLKKIIKDDINKKSFYYLKKNFNFLKKNKNNFLFDSKDYKILIKIFISNKTFLLKKYRIYFYQKLINLKEKYFTEHFKRYFNRIINKTGFHIVFLGCDGTGKTSQINSLIRSKLNTNVFRNYSVYHLYTKSLFKNKSPNLPYQKKNYGPILSFLKIIFLYFKFLFNYFLELYPKFICSSLIINDRYYHDVIIDPKRYRIGFFKPFLNFIFQLLPNPDLIIILDTKIYTLLKRKNELNINQIKEISLKYKSFKKNYKNCYIVKTNSSIEKTSKKIIDLIIYHKVLLNKKYFKKR